MPYLSPKVKNKKYIFRNTTSFDNDDNLEWNNLPIGILKHEDNPIKIFIDASFDEQLKQWRYSGVDFQNVEITGNHVIVSKENGHFGKYFNDNKDKIRVKLEFNNQHRLLTYQPEGQSKKTITTYDGLEKTGLPEIYRNKIVSYAYDSGILAVEINEFSQYGSEPLNTLTFTVNTDTTGQVNDTLDIEIYLDDANNDPVENAPIYFSQTGVSQYSIVHTDGSYSLTDANGKATATVTLHNIGKTTITADVNQPSELSQTQKIICVNDETQIYITGVTIDSTSFTDDPQEFFKTLDDALREIDDFEWWELGINQAEIINSSDEVTTQIMIFMKEGKYNNNQYLSASDSSSLRTAIVNKLNSITGLTFTDVELRCNRVFYNS